MKPEVMIDLETMSDQPNTGIVSIGACKFTPDGEIVDTFYQNVEPSGQRELGLDICPNTIEWWKQQDPAALKALSENRVDIREAWVRFCDWYGDYSMETWSRGASFDLVVLKNLVLKLYGRGSKTPWKYWDERCQRTIEAFCPMPDEDREGTHHNALDDAITQAKHVAKFYANFGPVD